MKDMFTNVEVWEQAWSRYETDHEVTRGHPWNSRCRLDSLSSSQQNAP